MYKELYDFGVMHKCAPVKNRKRSKIACHINLDADGTYLGVSCYDKKDMPNKLIPDFGSKAATSARANAIVEKRVNIFDQEIYSKPNKKNISYLENIAVGADKCKSLHAIFSFLTAYRNDSAICSQVNDELDKNSIKSDAVISYRIESEYVEDMEDDWNDWLVERLASFEGKQSDKKMGYSCISGRYQELCPAQNGPAIRNVPNDVKAAFGLGRPVFISALKENSYQSYGFDGGEGTQFGLEDAETLVGALEYLFNDPNYYNKDFKIVYFYDKEVYNVIYDSLQNDVLSDVDAADLDTLCEELENDVAGHMPILSKIFAAARIGAPPPDIPDDIAKFYMVSFTTPSSRYYLSNELSGSYKDLINNLSSWYRDTCIFDGRTNKCNYKIYVLIARCISSVNLKGSDVFERAEKEFGSVKNDLLTAVYTRKQIPFIFYQRALWRFGVHVSAGEGALTPYAQIIKVYLIRKGYEIMPDVSNNANVAYNCGRLLAVYDQLQWMYHNSRNKKVGKSISQSYFTMCAKYPSLGFSELSKQAVVYLEGIGNIKKIYYTKLIADITSNIGTAFPAKFSIDDQGSYALGYYQQRNDFFKSKKADNINNDADIVATEEE